MNRLQSELLRLYLAGSSQDDGAASLLDGRGLTRALVLGISQRAGCDAVSRIWRGCQLELGLPAPGVAVSGVDGFELWFSLAEPVSAAQGKAFLESLCARLLPDVDARHLHPLPAPDPASPAGARHAVLVPAQQAREERWSAFVAPDLLPLFADTPWLDIPPGIDGQADLLCRLASIRREAFEEAAARLRPTPPAPLEAVSPAPLEAALSAAPGAGAARAPAPGTDEPDPRAFLLEVMRDETVALALRIEAAKALLCASPAAQRPVADPAPARP